MEVIGTVSSAITVADFAATGVRKVLQTLKRLKKAPQELQSLLEQVEGIVLVVKTVSEIPVSTNAEHGLTELLDRLKRQLLELEQLIHFKLVKPTEELEVDRIAWSRHATEVLSLLDSISQTINYLNTTLSAATLVQLTRLQRRIEESSVSSDSRLYIQSQSLSSLSGKLDGLSLLCEHIRCSPGTIDNICRVIEPLQQTGAQVLPEEHQLRARHGQPVTQYATGNVLPNTIRLPRRRLVRPNMGSSALNELACSKFCRCRCHKRQNIHLPSSLRHWIGTLHVSVANFGYLQSPCTLATCRRLADQGLIVQYTFPTWFAAAVVSGYYKKSVWGSVDRYIRVIQIVETDAFSFIMEDDIVSLRALYSEGRACVHDISPRSGYTALVQAIISAKHDVIRFLIDNGADKTQEDLYGIDANNTVLETYLGVESETEVEGFSALFDIDGLMEEQNFTLLHRIVVGCSSYALADALYDFQEHINTPDMSGRTPLFWAVWREDFENAKLLLLHGADIGVATRDGRTIFHLMSQVTCGQRIFSILTDSDSDSDMMETLSAQDLRYQINRQDSGGHSPFHLSICFSDFYGTDLLNDFLNYGADLSLKSAASGQTSFHYILMHADADALSCLFRDLSGVDLLAIDDRGRTAMDFLLARFQNKPLVSIGCSTPSSCSTDLVALVKFVSHARNFELRLPRIMYGPRLCTMGNEPDFCLFNPLSNTSDTKYEWSEWVDVEEWCKEHGHLEIPSTVESEALIDESDNGRTEGRGGDSVAREQ